jgi:hypothetical protein
MDLRCLGSGTAGEFGHVVCCVFPAVMVSLGAGAVLVGVVSVFPQVVWLGEHKAAVFALAALLLVLSGSMLHRASRLPCPTDPDAAMICRRLRRVSAGLFWAAVATYVAGGGFVLIAAIIAGS